MCCAWCVIKRRKSEIVQHKSVKNLVSIDDRVSVCFCCFVGYSTRQFVLCLTLCYFVLVFFSPLALRLPRLGKRELILVLFVRFFDLRLFGFDSFLFLLVSGKGCGL